VNSEQSILPSQITPWSVVCRLWTKSYGLLTIDRGLSTKSYGLLTIDQGLILLTTENTKTKSQRTQRNLLQIRNTPLSVDRGPKAMDYGLLTIDRGLSTKSYGLLTIDHGLILLTTENTKTKSQRTQRNLLQIRNTPLSVDRGPKAMDYGLSTID
jgi:hypothetical protein